MTQRRDDERGVAAVEFALVMPILLMLLFGLISTAQVYSDHLAANNAVREAARYGSSADVSSAAWATSVRDRVKQVYFNAGTTVADSQICVRLLKSDGSVAKSALGGACGDTPSAPSGMASGSCAVQVWMQRPATIELIVFPSLNFDIGAQSVSYYGRVVAPTCTAL